MRPSASSGSFRSRVSKRSRSISISSLSRSALIDALRRPVSRSSASSPRTAPRVSTFTVSCPESASLRMISSWPTRST